MNGSNMFQPVVTRASAIDLRGGRRPRPQVDKGVPVAAGRGGHNRATPGCAAWPRCPANPHVRVEPAARLVPTPTIVPSRVGIPAQSSLEVQCGGLQDARA
jgi:hypothetical protein